MRLMLALAVSCSLLSCASILLGDDAEATTPEAASDAANIAARIDELIAARWEADHIIPTVQADDAEFLRRAYLDIIGTIPSVAEAREFLEDTHPEKRRLLLERLLSDPRYVVNFTSVWKHVLIPEVEADFNFIYFAPIFESWLRVQLLENRPYDEMVHDILTTPLDGQSLYGYDVSQGVSPAAFYQAKETKPENLAAATSRMFLGTRIECAQCHDHPFDHWTQEDFWSYAAFFASLQRESGQEGFFAAIRELLGSTKLQIPETDQYVGPRFLGATEPADIDSLAPRVVLANWMTSDENTLFAEMAVNRMWAHFFGTGLVDPVDDFGEFNPASHPELLQYLAAEFVAHDYDLKLLMQAITSTRAYQLSSRITDPSQNYARRFAVMPLRGLTKDQLLASLGEAVGRFKAFDISNPYVFFGDTTPETEFGEMFGEQDENSTNRQTSILQSLLMMNGQLTSEATDLQNSQTLTSILQFPDFDTGDRVEAVFLAALTRLPTDQEREQFVSYVDSGGVADSSDAALSDVFWVLLNSAEFRFNH